MSEEVPIVFNKRELIRILEYLPATSEDLAEKVKRAYDWLVEHKDSEDDDH